MFLSRKKSGMVAGACLAALTLAACAGAGEAAGGDGDGDLSMVQVVKLTGIPWFDRMEVGVLDFATETGHDTRVEGGTDVSPETQIQIIQNLIAQSPDAIAVVPNSPESLHAVLAQAREAGIVVVSHEAPGIENVDINIEAFDNAEYGRTIARYLAACMGGEGEFVQFVGGLTAQTHMDWTEAAYAYIAENFPNMTRVVTQIESGDNSQQAYERAVEILARFPNLRGFQGSAGNDVPGIARAVEEAGRVDQTCVMGTSIPSASMQFLENGSIDKIFFWDPALAGKAQLRIAEILIEGGEITEGTDLGIPGYENLQLMPGFGPNHFMGDAAIAADLELARTFDF